MIKHNRCRISKEPLVELFSLGLLHLSDFPARDDTRPRKPVELKLCLAPTSGLVQLSHTASLDEMYREYWYRSGISNTMRAELKQIAEMTQYLSKVKSGDIWVDIGCNDGTLLSFVDKRLIKVGFDPAKNGYASEARQHANLVVEDYFTANAYKKSKYGKKQAKVVTSIAMFYDLENPNSFVEDINKILDNDGVWMVQMSYLPLMLDQLAFDNICHEHLEYYSLTSFKYLMEKHGFEIVDCQLNDSNGGFFRVFLRKKGANPVKFATAPYREVAKFRVQSILHYEKSLKLNHRSTYLKFYREAVKLKNQTVNFIKKEKAKGKSIWGYGASTKGNTLLQWFGLDHTLIDAIAERHPVKYGRKTVSTNIPILSEEEMRKLQPDYLLVLPWHFINEFCEREAAFLNRGGKFIVPCPKFEIMGADN
ncbi:MAG: methyltransferase domain-containing protein [Candidatus Vogelbacteria bacterium]|nr:methyltransferase domain-containing protein [Candidatus Vogelbacteria bacterium]